MAAHSRIIQLPSQAAQIEQILIQSNQPLEILGEQLSFWGDGAHLQVYENGQLKAILQNYYEYFDAAPLLDSASNHYVSMATVPTQAETHALASQTLSSESLVGSFGTGAQSSVSAGWLVGGLLVAGGVAAAAGGGGGSDKDEDNSNKDNPNQHNGSVNESQYTGEVANTEAPYFIKVLQAENSLGFLANPSIWKGIGQGLDLTYSFSSSDFEVIHKILINKLEGVVEFSETQKTDIRDAMAQYSRYANINFKEVDQNADADFVIYLDNLESIPDPDHSTDTLGYAYFGGNLHLLSTVYSGNDAFNKNQQFTWGIRDGDQYPYQNGYSVALHELGHVLGLEHPFDDNRVLKAGWTKAEDVDATTVMTYNAHEKIESLAVPNKPNYFYKNVGVHQTDLGVYDIAALNYLYGVNKDFHSGNDTYTFGRFDYKADSSTSGAIANVYIADGGGSDTIDASNQSGNAYINLTSGSWNYVGSKADTLAFDSNGNPQSGQLFIGYGTQIESAKGGKGNDTLIGNSADNFLYGYSGNDTINGGAGNDQIEGGQGSDILIGGAGADTFLFRSQFDNTADIIRDFNSSENDSIHLAQSIFSSLSLGALPDSQFIIGEAAADADDFIIFNSSTQQLFYDSDGNGSNAAVHIATLENNASLSAAQIFII